jgi:hypothetical protein
MKWSRIIRPAPVGCGGLLPRAVGVTVHKATAGAAGVLHVIRRFVFGVQERAVGCPAGRAGGSRTAGGRRPCGERAAVLGGGGWRR